MLRSHRRDSSSVARPEPGLDHPVGYVGICHETYVFQASSAATAYAPV